MKYLLATDCPRTTESACDYLNTRLDTGDTVHVLGLAEGHRSESTTTAAAHLPDGVTVTTTTWDGDSIDDLVDAASTVSPDEFVICTGSRDVAADGGLDAHVGSLLQRTDCPVRVATGH
ncbi:hypothetical protein [Haloarchaeobius sp. TZWWS8]|uniref:hypothetical protein n=1 Tax=Haloarchaeobius sp. TZWWS8 TaxID=3446121 RepID=UPI003EBC593D